MLEVLDLRTLMINCMLIYFLFGVGLILYSISHQKFIEISTIGSGFLCDSQLTLAPQI